MTSSQNGTNANRPNRARLPDPIDENPYRRELTERQLRHLVQSCRLEIDRLRILLAWEAGELSAGQARRLLNTDYVEARDYRLRQLAQLKRDMEPVPITQEDTTS